MKKTIALLSLLILLFSVGTLFGQEKESHYVWGDVYEADGVKHPPQADLSFEAFILSRPGEILDENSIGCGYGPPDFSVGEIGIQCASFPTPWSDGDTLHVTVTRPSTGGIVEGEVELSGYFDILDDLILPPFIYLQVAYSDLTPCNFNVGEMDSCYVINTHGAKPASPDTLFWGDPAIEAYDDTLKIAMEGFAFGGDNITVWVQATSPILGQEANMVTYTVSGYVHQYWTFAQGYGLTLPVELSAFTATFMNEYTLIEWTTASENDVQGFNIYRNIESDFATSGDPLNVSLIPGNGTTNQSNYYTFHDDDPLDLGTTYYYWLESVDLGGYTQVYDAISFTPEDGGQAGYKDEFKINILYKNRPNPCQGTTMIKYAVKGKLKIDPVEFKIYNAAGQLVKTDYAYNGRYHLDATDLPAGVYFYQIKTDTFNKVQKMVITK